MDKYHLQQTHIIFIGDFDHSAIHDVSDAAIGCRDILFVNVCADMDSVHVWHRAIIQQRRSRVYFGIQRVLDQNCLCYCSPGIAAD